VLFSLSTPDSLLFSSIPVDTQNGVRVSPLEPPAKWLVGLGIVSFPKLNKNEGGNGALKKSITSKINT